MNAISVEIHSKKWFVFRMPIKSLPVQNARARTPERKFRLLPLLEHPFQAEVLHLPVAVADQAAVFPEQVNFNAGRALVF